MDKFKALLFIGPPGAGKGTAGEFFEKNGPFLHFSTGEYFENLQNKQNLSLNEKLAVKDMDKGIYVREGLPEILFKERIYEMIQNNEYNPNSQILISDVIPRTPQQIKPIEEFVNFLKVFHIFISKDYELMKKETIKRITGRNRNSKDKDPNKLLKRIREYKAEKGEQVVEYYRDKNIVTEIQNNNSKAAYEMLLERLVYSTLSEVKIYLNGY